MGNPMSNQLSVNTSSDWCVFPFSFSFFCFFWGQIKFKVIFGNRV